MTSEEPTYAMNVEEPQSTPNQGALARARDARRRTAEGGGQLSAASEDTPVEAPPADPWTDVTPQDPADAPPPYASTPYNGEAAETEAVANAAVAVDIDEANAPSGEAAAPAPAGKGRKFGRNLFTVKKKKEDGEKKPKEETTTRTVKLESGPPLPAAVTVEAGAASSAPQGWQLLVVYLEVASLVLMWASAKYVDDLPDGVSSKAESLGNYAVAASVLSLVLCLALHALSKFKPALLEKRVMTAPKLGELNLLQVLALFLLLWWILAATIVTFEGPFVVTSNGYLSAWAGLYFAAALAAQLLEPVAQKMRSAAELTGRPRLLAGIALCGGCVMLASIEHVDSEPFKSESAWGVSVGVLTLVIAAAALFFAAKITPKAGKALSVLLLVMWVCGIGVLTFEGPFLATGNGFFGAWGGLFCAFLLVLLEFELKPPALPLPQHHPPGNTEPNASS